MAHWDLRADRARVAAMAPGPTGQHPYVDNLIRLSKVPAATISEIRGRVRGAGSEFVLATDVRFASDKAIVGQFEVGVGSCPVGVRWLVSPASSGAAGPPRSSSAATTCPPSSRSATGT